MSNVRLGRLAGLFAGVLVLVLLPARAWSEIVDEVEVGHLTFGLQFGYGQTRMSEYNDNIDVLNNWINNQGDLLREADHLNGSGTIAGELRYKFGNRFSVGAGVGNAQAKSSFYVTFGDVNFFARSTVWSLMGYYHLPFVDNFGELADRMSIYVGAGPVLLTNGSTNMRIADRTREPFNVFGDLSELDGEGKGRGNGSGLQGLVGSSYQLTSRVSVALEVGYRYAKIKDLELSDIRGYETEVTGDPEEIREPGDEAILDFFRRDKRPAGLPDKDISGRDIPYYSDFGGPLELNFSGVQGHLAFRLHIF
jgi:opacity protein-like surface antigen